jgi:hypothetical protein
MRNRAEQILRVACWILGALVFYELVIIGFRANPLIGVKIPALPTLSADASAPGTNRPPTAEHGTNHAHFPSGTNIISTNTIPTNAIPTNAISTNGLPAVGTNAVASSTSGPLPTNAVALPSPAAAATNVAVLKSTPNAPPPEIAGLSTNQTTPSSNAITRAASPGTNAITNLAAIKGTNAAGTNAVGTNIVAAKGTNSPIAPPNGPGMARMSPRGAGMPGMMGAPDLPPPVQARINRVIESEILGQIIHPQPMALLGIAGDCAFLRAPSGQTGMVKEGDDLGSIKLIRIGTNRVLVEENGRQQELTIFSGFGGDSLLPKGDTSK